jgi:hypothetical protein
VPAVLCGREHVVRAGKGRLSVQSVINLCLRKGWHCGEAVSAPGDQPHLDDELEPAAERVGSEHSQAKSVGGRQNEVHDTEDHRARAGDQQGPLVVEACATAKCDDELRRAADERPDAEDDENVRDGSGRGQGEGDCGDDADRGVGEQQLSSRSVLTLCVDEAGDDVDDGIEDDQDPSAGRHGRVGVGHRHENDGPGNSDEATREEQVHKPCVAE